MVWMCKVQLVLKLLPIFCLSTHWVTSCLWHCCWIFYQLRLDCWRVQLFTAAPPLAMGILDQVCSANTMMRYPKLYSHRPSQFDNKVFWVWICNALFHSVLLFWLPMYAVKNDIVWANSKEGGYLVLGNMVYTVGFGFSSQLLLIHNKLFNMQLLLQGSRVTLSFCSEWVK